jgi:hypothetical protein
MVVQPTSGRARHLRVHIQHHGKPLTQAVQHSLQTSCKQHTDCEGAVWHDQSMQIADIRTNSRHTWLLGIAGNGTLSVSSSPLLGGAADELMP